MVGVEIDMVVIDSLKALELYEKVFDIERIEVSNFLKGENEAIFNIYGVRFHLLDENPKFDLIAPNPDQPKSIWFNILVPDVKETYSRAINAGCIEIQPVTEIREYGVTNAIFSDTYGYIWMIQQINEEVSYEERTRLWEEKRDSSY